MKLQIDTIARTITLNSPVNLGELIVMLNNMFPQQSWKQYELIVKEVIDWSPLTPVIPYQPTAPFYPWCGPTYVDPITPLNPNTIICSGIGNVCVPANNETYSGTTTYKMQPSTYTVTF